MEIPLKSRIRDAVEECRQELIELSLRIHGHPELGLQEERAAAWLTGFLARHGFHIETGIAGLPTAFRASYGGSPPAIALLAEYDALPEVGHACGHNIIGASAAGAAVASRLAVDQLGGSVVVIGTPAEELLGGKTIMTEKGVFHGIEAAMAVHPGTRNIASIKSLACVGLEVKFYGKPAHASARPAEGLNALEAMLQSFNNINSLRQHVRPKERIHGIITDGGQAANIVPAHSAGSFLVRAENEECLAILKEKVLACFKAAAMATGTQLEYKWAEPHYMAMKVNQRLAGLLAANLEALGRKMHLYEGDLGLASTDMGNVSQVVPAIHPCIGIAPPATGEHTPEFARAAASEDGHRGMLDGAKAMAMTVFDLLSNREALARVKEEFLYGLED
ncbi:MAG: M20 family metallopeptidase [Chloroflexi bacterium]|nr:M20 family metallopeptidase [Chloroflexota bacterium]